MASAPPRAMQAEKSMEQQLQWSRRVRICAGQLLSCSAAATARPAASSWPCEFGSRSHRRSGTRRLIQGWDASEEHHNSNQRGSRKDGFRLSMADFAPKKDAALSLKGAIATRHARQPQHADEQAILVQNGSPVIKNAAVHTEQCKDASRRESREPWPRWTYRAKKYY